MTFNDEDLRETEVVQHATDTNNAPPTLLVLEEFSYILREELEKELGTLERLGCIEESTSTKMHLCAIKDCTSIKECDNVSATFHCLTGRKGLLYSPT